MFGKLENEALSGLGSNCYDDSPLHVTAMMVRDDSVGQSTVNPSHRRNQINLSPNEAERAPRLPNPNRYADGEAEQAPRLPNPNCHYDSAAKRAPRSPNPNRHLHGDAERVPRLPNPNCHDDSEAHRAPRLPNPNCHYGSEALILPCEATT